MKDNAYYFLMSIHMYLQIVCFAGTVPILSLERTSQQCKVPRDNCALKRLLADRAISVEDLQYSLRRNLSLTIDLPLQALVLRNAHCVLEYETKKERIAREQWDADMIRFFLILGMDPQGKDFCKGTHTVLQWCFDAVRKPHDVNIPALVVLVTHGARFHHKNRNDETALHFLVRKMAPREHCDVDFAGKRLWSESMHCYAGTIEALVEPLRAKNIDIDSDIGCIDFTDRLSKTHWWGETLLEKAHEVGMLKQDIVYLQRLTFRAMRWKIMHRERKKRRYRHLLALVPPCRLSSIGIPSDIVPDLVAEYNEKNKKKSCVGCMPL